MILIKCKVYLFCKEHNVIYEEQVCIVN